MNFKIVIVFSLFLFGCATQKQTEFSEKELKTKAAWVNTYKQSVFKNCLYKGLHIRENCDNIFRLDNSLPQDFPFGLGEYRYMDTLAQIPIQAAKKDSAERYVRFLEYRNKIERDELNGLPIVRHCLDFYTSPELDNLVKSRYQK